MGFTDLGADEQRRLISEGSAWADSRLATIGSSSSSPIVRDALAGFYCGVGQARIGAKALAGLTDATNEVLGLAVLQCADADIVGADGSVQPDTFLFALVDEFYAWAESPDEQVQGFGKRCLHAWNSLFSLSNPGYELGLQMQSTGPAGVERSRPVPPATGPSGATYDELVAQLNDMVGLVDVKRQIMTEIVSQRANAERTRRDLPAIKPNLHMVFSGNPGTGKTTVARIIAEIYHHAGILSRGHLIEVGPGDMMGRWQGENTQRALEVVESAVGGVLLIDEAYTLAGTPDKGPMDFQQQVIDTLVKGMEDKRTDLVVILTGYSGPMERFVRTNAGLESRIGEWVYFPDYTTDELMHVFKLLLDKYEMTIDESGLDELVTELKQTERTDRFGNARLVRNIFEDLVGALNLRLSNRNLTDVTTEDLNGITVGDVLEVREEILSGRANAKRPLRIGFTDA